jgi:metal-responsive CopG/Arc/MetJ family transcriptional regulator
MSLSRMKTKTTTIRLPVPLYDQIQRVIETEIKGRGSMLSFNELIVAAIKAYLKMNRRHRIDAAFVGMGADADYQKEATLLAQDFEYSDWEALELEEKELTGEPVEYDSNPAR